jgi:hypothetical protein
MMIQGEEREERMQRTAALGKDTPMQKAMHKFGSHPHEREQVRIT